MLPNIISCCLQTLHAAPPQMVMLYFHWQTGLFAS